MTTTQYYLQYINITEIALIKVIIALVQIIEESSIISTTIQDDYHF